MYQSYFGLREAPFSIAPDPQYLYMSTRHQEALAHLMYGIQSDGAFILLTGEVGTGKTTICRRLLSELPDDVDTAFIVNPKQTADELLASICDDLAISYPEPASTKVLVDRLNTHLLAKLESNRRTLVIIDEAQNLSTEVLEQLRLLTNLETDKRKLLQIILLGQPELLDLLAQRALRQLSQRITARFHLDALTPTEVTEYVGHRLSVAGVPHSLFSRAAIRRVFKRSGGIPRLINLICDRALLGAYGQDKSLVSRRLVDRAANEVLAARPPSRNSPTGHSLAIAGWVMAVLVASVAVVQIIPGDADLAASLAELTRPWSQEVVVPVQRDNGDSLKSVVGHDSQRDAFNDLFALWGLYLEDPEADPCAAITPIGLACHTADGDVDAIRALNRPVLLQLTENGQWLTVSGLREDQVTLIARDRQYEVNAQHLAGAFNGRFTLLWRMPPGYRGPIRPGESGTDVDWLAGQLAAIDNRTEQPTGHLYDEDMIARVKTFQGQVNLPSDGIVGPLLWVHLNTAEGGDVPILHGAGDH